MQCRGDGGMCVCVSHTCARFRQHQPTFVINPGQPPAPPWAPPPWLRRWGRRAVQVVTLAMYTCFSRCTVHLAAQRDLQFHTSHGAGGWFACAFLRWGSYGLNYHLMATPGPRPFACLSCEKDLEEPTSGFDCCNCRLIE